MKIASSKQMRELENKAAARLGVSEGFFLEKAGFALAQYVSEYTDNNSDPCAAIICGRGLNGADGMAAARHLIKRGCKVWVFTVGYERDPAPLTLNARLQFEIAGGTVLSIEEDLERAMSVLTSKSCDVVVDALFGIGFSRSREPDKHIRAAISLINCFERTVISVDIPSGVDPDTGETWEVFVRADRTITFTLPKPAHYLSASQEYCGALDIVDIGIPPELIEQADIRLSAFENSDFERNIPPRRQNSHKGDYGRLLILAGSRGYTGAAALAARAALRTGAGTVSLGVPASVYPILAMKLDEAMVFPLPEDENGMLARDASDEILKRLLRSDALLMGCGLGRGGDIPFLVETVIGNASVPVILDADGLNALASNINMLKGKRCGLVLTPHRGEFIRLFGENYKLEGENDPSAAIRLASEHGCVIVMKGHRTVTADSMSACLNLSGNAGLAKGGSGDVLAGIIASFAVQGMALGMAAAFGVSLHGRAGDLAAENLGQYSMLPSDIIAAIPSFLKSADRRKTFRGD